jgi:hypothetical protein
MSYLGICAGAFFAGVSPTTGSTSRLAYDSRSILLFKAFEKTHLYNFMYAVLGIEPATNDGDPAVTRDMLR